MIMQRITNCSTGADRFKISVQLSKKALTDYEDTNFVELFRTNEGQTKNYKIHSLFRTKKIFCEENF